MTAVDVVRVELDVPGEVAARARALHDQAFEHDGHDSLGDEVWRDLESPGHDSASFFASVDDRDRAFLHVARADNRSERQWVMGLVVLPDAGADASTTSALVAEALTHIERAGGGNVVLWRFAADRTDEAALRASGFVTVRELIEMRVALPLASKPVWPEGVTIRTFEPGRDEDAWVDVNNRAFRGHPEQGGWTRATLQRRMAEPWFDPSIFLLASDEDGVVGFSWMKQHAPRGRDPELGEIFAIGVDPRAQQIRLGRPLAIAGLALLAVRGVRTGMLFVAAEHERARALYTSLGFVEHRLDRAYERMVPST